MLNYTEDLILTDEYKISKKTPNPIPCSMPTHVLSQEGRVGGGERVQEVRPRSLQDEGPTHAVRPPQGGGRCDGDRDREPSRRPGAEQEWYFWERMVELEYKM